MQKKQEAVMCRMTLKNRIKFIILCLFAIIVLTGSLVFFTNVCGGTIKGIFTEADTVYYSWRDVFIALYIPVMGYYDILVFLLMFLPFTLRLATLWHNIANVIYGYIIIAFILTTPLSLYISYFPLSDYQSCGLKGPFSGVHYVKDLRMCEQFKYHPQGKITKPRPPQGL
ncbi:DUF1240 domain-containing protein [Salmonella enterica subsp. enterica]|nr:DUF1240 domain-containing protein [Salmonella enterica subsp. enterica]